MAVVLGAAHSQLLAQQRPDAGQILEQIKEPPPAPRTDPQIIPQQQRVKPGLSAPPGLRVTVKTFRITGNTTIPEATLLESVREFVGKELDIDGLNDAATKIRAQYLERGYFLVEAYLPQQQIRDGVVEIAVIEGRFGKVELRRAPGTRLSEKLVRGILDAHIEEGSLITEAGLERPILLIGDLPGGRVASEIRPSDAKIGAADLTLSLDKDPGLISGFVDFDNSGNRFVGQYRFGVYANLRNPIGWGDQFSLRAFTTDERKNDFLRLVYLVPAGYLGTRIGASYTTIDYRLAKDFAALLAHGTADVVNLYATHPFVRTRNTNVIGQLTFERKKLDDRVDTQNSIKDTTIDAVKAGVVGDFRDLVLGGGFNAYTLTLTDGRLALSPASEATADQAAAGFNTQGRFSKTQYDFRRLQRITANSTLLLSVTGQFASKNLASAEKFSLGGPNSVRAYPVGEGLGDTGYIFQGEFRYMVPGFKVAGGDVTVSGFWDQGWVRINENNPATNAAVANNRRLSGYGIGASVGKEGDFVVRASAAWRNENEAPTADTASRIPRVWVQAIKWF